MRAGTRNLVWVLVVELAGGVLAVAYFAFKFACVAAFLIVTAPLVPFRGWAWVARNRDRLIAGLDAGAWAGWRRLTRVSRDNDPFWWR